MSEKIGISKFRTNTRTKFSEKLQIDYYIVLNML